MSLIETVSERFVKVEKTVTADGFGGSNTVYVDGVDFDCAITQNRSSGWNVAQSEQAHNEFTLTTDKSIILMFHDVVKRNRDGKCFLVIAEDMENGTPRTSALNLRQVTAEEWELPNG